MNLIYSFGIVTRILTDLPLQSYQPLRLLDIGCGSGSASLYDLFLYLTNRAAIEKYPSVNEVTLIDGSEYMLKNAADLLQSSSRPFKITSYSSLPLLLQHVRVWFWCYPKAEPSYDLILMDRFLSDLPSNKARASSCVIAWGIFLSPS